MIKTKVLFVYFVIVTNISLAKTYYIDNSNGDDQNNGRSPITAWKSLYKLSAGQKESAWSQILPGDSILLKRGKVFEPSDDLDHTILGAINFPPDYGGSENKYIILGAYGTGHKPIVSVRNMTKKRAALREQGLSFVIIQDIEFRGDIQLRSSPAGTHHLIFRNIVLDGSYNGGRFYTDIDCNEISGERWNCYPLHHIEIAHSKFQNTNGYDAVNFMVTTGDIWFHHNEVYNSHYGECLDFGQGDNIVVEYNLFSGTENAKNGVKFQAQRSTLKNLIFRGNLIMGADLYGLVVLNAINSQIYNNTIIAKDGAYGFYAALFGWIPSNPVYICNFGATGFDKNLIANNIFYGNVGIGIAKGVKIIYKGGVEISYIQDDIWDDNIFQNNAYFNPGNNNQLIRLLEYKTGEVYWSTDCCRGSACYCISSSPETYNNWVEVDSDWQDHDNIHNELNVQPLFRNPYWNSAFDFGDYRLQKSSLLIDAGVFIPEDTIDLNGIYSPGSSSPDIGGFQGDHGVNSLLNPTSGKN